MQHPHYFHTPMVSSCKSRETGTLHLIGCVCWPRHYAYMLSEANASQ